MLPSLTEGGVVAVVIVAFYSCALAACLPLRRWTFAHIWTGCLEGLLDGATRQHKKRFFTSLHLKGRVLDIGSGSGNQLRLVTSSPCHRT